MWELVEELKKLLQTDNRNIYIHCFGGHGRTGSVLINLLQSLFELNEASVMTFLKKSYKQRGTKNYCKDSLIESQIKRLEIIMYQREKIIRKLQKS